MFQSIIRLSSKNSDSKNANHSRSGEINQRFSQLSDDQSWWDDVLMMELMIPGRFWLIKTETLFYQFIYRWKCINIRYTSLLPPHCTVSLSAVGRHQRRQSHGAMIIVVICKVIPFIVIHDYLPLSLFISSSVVVTRNSTQRVTQIASLFLPTYITPIELFVHLNKTTSTRHSPQFEPCSRIVV